MRAEKHRRNEKRYRRNAKGRKEGTDGRRGAEKGLRRVGKKNIRALLLFELLYKAAFLIVMYLLFMGVIRLLLAVTGQSYLTLENMRRFLMHPATLPALCVLLLICAVLYLVETVSLIVFYQGYVRRRNIGVTQILLPGLRETVYLLKKRGSLAVLAFAFVNALVTLAPIIAVFAVRFRVPAFIAQVIVEQRAGLCIVAVLALACVIVNFFGIYFLYYCVLEDDSLGDGFKKSVRLIRKHFFRFLARLLGINAVLTLACMLVYGLVLVTACYIIYQTKPEHVLVAAMLKMCDEVMVYMGILVTIASQIVNYANLSFFFSRYGPEPAFGNRVERFWERIAREDDVWRLENGERGGSLRSMHSRYTRGIALAAAVVFLLNAFSLYDAFRNGSLADKETLFGTYITAHRGASAQAPENTLAALELAIEHTADFAEIDVQLTQDGVVVLMHDASLKRTTGKDLTVSKITYGELQTLDAGSWFGHGYEGTAIPTLEEVIRLCKGRINLNIEIKSGKSAEKNEELVEKVVALIKEYDLEAQCVVSSTDPAMLAGVKERDSGIKTGYILSFAYGSFYGMDFVDFFSLKSSFINESLVKTLHSLGKEVHAWTVNTRSDLERMNQLGVDNIITDNAVLAGEVIYGERGRIGFFRLLGLIRQ
ncbi:MAG: glycerophosphodiester phosphodiesterase [Lachnospiraceae bacterium]|nr:glycerophosphodiester phosphodiesterase [Lachnospiraceae bacterium]